MRHFIFTTHKINTSNGWTGSVHVWELEDNVPRFVGDIELVNMLWKGNNLMAKGIVAKVLADDGYVDEVSIVNLASFTARDVHLGNEVTKEVKPQKA